jgi:hypothetical protein
MGFDPSRLRRGELLVGAGAVVLPASMFLLKWYGLSGQPAPTGAKLGSSTSVNGWHALTTIRWLELVTVVCGLWLVYLQASRRAPALSVTLSVIVTVLSFLTSLALLYRVLINEPGPVSLVELKPGAYVGLLAAIAITYGGYRSMRQEGIADRDAPAEIETVRVNGL